MNKKQKINIGLDIGIASVGWAIISTEYLEEEISSIKIIDHGVRLFPTVDSPKDSKLTNEKRREKRSARRQVKRRRTLKRDFIKYLIDSKVITDIKFDINNNFVKEFLEKYINDHPRNPYELRKKGLTEKLSFKENIFLMYWYLSHRGFKYDVVGSEDTKEREKDLKKRKEEGLFKQNDFPINNQTRFYKKYGHYKGDLNRQFHNDSYIEEIKEIFKHQKDISQDLKDAFLIGEKAFFTRQRSFETGPGGEKSPSKYGLYQKQRSKIVKMYDNIWQKTIGKCSIYPKEYRAPKQSLSAALFNLLNDLNNLHWANNQKLTKEDKIAIIKIAFQEGLTPFKIKTYILKKYGIDKDKIEGFRVLVKKSGKEDIITKLESIARFNFNKKTGEVNSKPFKWEDFYDGTKFNLSVDDKNLNLIDEYVYQVSKSSVKDKRLENLQFLKNKYQYKDSDINYLVNNSPAFNQTHSWSFKALNQFIPWLLETNLNQMQLAHEKGIPVQRKLDFSKGKYITKDWIEDVVITPTAKRSLIQTINVINAILKKYIYVEDSKYEIDNVVVEMARELNNQQAKDKKKAIQDFGTQRNKKLEDQIKYVEDQYAKGHKNIAKSWRKKLYLLEQQKNCDAYDGEHLDWKDVVLNKVSTDIDHIIPYSICFDNSNANKVLTKSSNNSKKGKQTPYQFLSREDFEKMSKEWIKWYKPIKGQDNFYASNKKLNIITSKIDYSLPENQYGFIGRNLVDTRYVTKEIYAVLSKFFKDKDFVTKVKTINGAMTSFIRSYINRDLKVPEIPEELKAYVDEEEFNKKEQMKIRTWNGHHAQDAVIIASSILANQKVLKATEKLLSNPNYGKGQKQKFAEGHINTFNPEQSIVFKEIKDTLNKNINNVKFSYMLNKKKSTELFNETFYGGIRWKDEKTNQEMITKVSKTDYLVNLKKADCEKLFNDEKTKLACFKYDKELYNELKQIYLSYQEEPFPFKNHLKDKQVNFLTLKNGRRVKKLKKLEAEKSLMEIIIPQKNNNKNSFYESMEWIKIRIFKDHKNQNKIIPINAINYDFRTNSIKNGIYEKQLKAKNILDKDNFIDLYKGNIIVNEETGIKYFICGCHPKLGLLELKPLDFKKTKGYQNFKTLNTILKNFKIINLDLLGKSFSTYKKWKF